MQAGDTFLIAFRNTRCREHLWILVTEPDSCGEVVIISVTTLRNNIDQTVTLQPWDHPYINHLSAVLFGDARIVHRDSLNGDVGRAEVRRHRPCSPELHRLICDGILSSDFTPRKVASFCREKWGK